MVSFRLFAITTLLLVIAFVRADDDDDAWDSVKCGIDKECPEDKPCCSQYGVCGTGAYCLGGCDVRYSYSLDSCMPMPIFPDYENDFSKKDILEKQEKYLGNSSETDWVYTGWLDTSDDAILLQMPNQSTGTVISSTKYIWYGKISATMKSSRDRGVITAFILFSDVQDEVDYEFVGYNLTNPQTNYYYHGLLNYTNSENTSVSNTFENYHDYVIDWQEDKIDWYIDDKKVRTLEKKDTYNETLKAYKFPQTPARVQFSLWPGGDSSNGLGTIEWAGGEINWDSQDIEKYGYYYAFVKNIKIEAYDMPDFVEKIHSEEGGDDFNAFLYNSTDGNEDNIYLTNRKTWLGSGKATGLDPDNESDDEDESSSSQASDSSESGSSSTKTSTSKSKSTSTGDLQVPGARTKTGGGDSGAKTTGSYDPSAGIGGFVQNSEETNSADSGDSDSTSSSSGDHHSVQAFVSVLSAVVLGIFSVSL